jgi:hypothetical protein
LDGGKTDFRVCLDFRHINALLSREGFSNGRVPRVEELLRRVTGFTHASCLDLSAAYQQLTVAAEDRHKTAFTYQGRHLQWKRWPFGLNPATAQFQKVMEVVLEGIEGVVIYVDDVCIATKGNMEDHIKIVQQVLERFNEHGLRLNLDKCHFGYKTITMLGHQLSGEHRAIDPVKAKQAIDWQEPKSGKEIMRFLGFTNFLRAYIPEYAKVASSLDPLRTARKLALSDKQREDFNTLKRVINSAPLLSNPLDGVPFQVATDASQRGMGAVLYQEEPGSKKRRYIAFASKALDGAQKNYPANKRELLGVVHALRAFSHWLLGEHFTLFTDHEGLTTMFTAAKPSYVVDNWLDTLLEYDFEIRHRPGVQMTLPDALSRLYGEGRSPKGSRRHGQNHAETRDDLAMISAIHMADDDEMVNELASDEDTARAEQQLAEFIRERLDKDTIKGEEDQLKHLRAAHASGHFGADKLFKKVWRSGLFWKGLRRQCSEVVATCHSCLQYNVKRAGFHPPRSLRANGPWDHVAIDCAVDLPVSRKGNAHILIIVDVNTRYVITKPLPNLQQATMARALFEVFTQFGPPKAIQSDRGPEFVNEVVKHLTEQAGVDHRLVAPYNPQANGMAERMVRAS